MKKINLFILALVISSAFLAGCTKTKSNKDGSGFISTPKETLDKVNNAKSNLIGGNKLPSSVDLSSKLPPPGNQGQQNSCVGWSVGYAMKTYQEKASRNWELTQGSDIVSKHVFSPSYIYNQINKGKDNGAMFADAFNLLRTKGISTLEKKPYDETDYTSMPDENANKEAASFKIAWAKTISPKDLSELKSYLVKGYPIIIAISYDENFMSLKGPEIITDMNIGENAMGHAMVLVGYDDSKKAFKIMNSWGIGWGDRGYCWMSYDAFKKCIRECWIAKDVDGDKQIKDEDEEQITNDNPVPDELVTGLKILNIDYNSVNPDDRDAGNSLKITCTAELDKNFGNTAQVIAFITFKDGKTVPAKMEAYSTPDGDAIGFTNEVDITSMDEQKQDFTIYIPYSALDLGGNKNATLVATPILFIDDFDATDGVAVPFELTLN